MNKNKKGQQSIGMSFGVIFSIFLIIVFMAAAIYAITFFLSLTDSASIGQFYEKLQGEVNSAWTSGVTEKNMTINLPKEISYVCFIDYNGIITNKEKDSQLLYRDPDTNLFLLPPGAAGDLDIKKINHINITKITSKNNPQCFLPGSQITIKKGLYSGLVDITQ